MNTREKLIVLIMESVGGCARNWAEVIADHLLKNGIIVPPCKVGDTVYVDSHFFVSEYKIEEIAVDDMFMRFFCKNEDYAIECRKFMFFDERIGKTVFLSREDAEKVIAERSKE